MIKCDKGYVEFEGQGSELLAELSTLIRALVAEGLGDAAIMHAVVDTAIMTHEELDRELNNALMNMLCRATGIDITRLKEGHLDEMMSVVNELKKGIKE